MLQSSDVSDFFKAVKKRLNGLLLKDAGNAQLVNRIQTVLKDRGEKDKFSSAMKKKIAESLTLVSYAIGRSMNCDIVKKGYIRTGQYPLDFALCMQTCHEKLSLQEYEQFKAALPSAVLEFQDKACLTEAWMDENGLRSRNVQGDIPKDQRPLQNQRSVLFNAPTSIAAFKAYRQRVDQAPALRQLAANEKRQKQLEKIQAKLLASTQKKITAATEKLRKEAMIVAEKERYNSLSKEEQKAERLVKSTAAAEKKAAKIRDLQALVEPPVI